VPEADISTNSIDEFGWLFLYKPKVEGHQKEREVNEAAYSQEFGRHRKSKKWDTDVIPPKIPARASRYKKRT
jgi:hypothetical protein